MPIEIPDTVVGNDREAIERLLRMIDTDDPTLEQIWSCMDVVWDELRCDNKHVDVHKFDVFYRHPVWLLNGLFIEQHAESLRNREIISNWIAQTNGRRIADFGGGFGTLARMIATKRPQVDIDVIEPYPHPLAIMKSQKFTNISYRTALCGEYDLIVAMDVFEHVPDPLRLVYETARYLKCGGIYLTANCFYPVIKCHLPVTFHFRRSWNSAMGMMRLRPIESVCYGFAFEKTGNANLATVRILEVASSLAFAVKEASRAARSRLKLRTRLRNALLARADGFRVRGRPPRGPGR
jgi:2-polyprenyl-3-methyl-5-hydroxy-6-metoxy-1,4-benzoquinol methylase